MRRVPKWRMAAVHIRIVAIRFRLLGTPSITPARTLVALNGFQIACKRDRRRRDFSQPKWCVAILRSCPDAPSDRTRKSPAAMSFLPIDWKSGIRVISMAVLTVSGASLGGCAGVGDSALSGAFVDPAKYELYDCKQLEAERKSLEARTAQLQGYIDKAQTGTAGTVVGEVAYRSDYISTRASLKLANEAWERGNCAATVAPPPASATAGGSKGRAGHR